MEEKTESDDSFLYIILIIIGGLALYNKYLSKIDLEEVKSSFIYFGLCLLVYFILPFVLVFLIVKIVHKITCKRKLVEEEIVQEIEDFMTTKFSKSSEVLHARHNLFEMIDGTKIRKKNGDLIDEAIWMLDRAYENLVENERNKARILKKEKRLEAKNKKLSDRLLGHFQEKKSAKAIPKWALSYSTGLIEKAKEEYGNLLTKEEEKRQKWDFACRFVKEHEAFPLDFGQLEKEERQMYVKSLRPLKAGKLEVKPVLISTEDIELLERRFFHVNELDPHTRDRFIHKYGYRHKAFIYPTGKSGNNLIIKNDERKESDYHFCMKHLFAEIDKRAIVEYSKNGLRTDVAFLLNGKKVAVEIETGSNKELQISNKVKWLNENFDYWVFVCSRKNLTKYRKYSDNLKSFCFPLKEGYNKVVQIATDITGDLDYNKPTSAI